MCVKPNLMQNNAKDKVITEMLNFSKEIAKTKNNKQKENLYRYELVRLLGTYNMLDPKARKLTGLTEKEYTYIIKNYNELMVKYPDVKNTARNTLKYIRSGQIRKIITDKGCNQCKKIVINELDIEIEKLCPKCRKLLCQKID